VVKLFPVFKLCCIPFVCVCLCISAQNLINSQSEIDVNICRGEASNLLNLSDL